NDRDRSGLLSFNLFAPAPGSGGKASGGPTAAAEGPPQHAAVAEQHQQLPRLVREAVAAALAEQRGTLVAEIADALRH
ncbi:unnamed protein product, partial [Heterosigma akashiwo]